MTGAWNDPAVLAAVRLTIGTGRTSDYVPGCRFPDCACAPTCEAEEWADAEDPVVPDGNDRTPLDAEERAELERLRARWSRER